MHQYVEERMLDYASFVSVIKDYVEERTGGEYEVRVFRVVKNNSLELDSLIILKEGTSSAPNIYLLPYYEAYLEGTQIEEISDRIISLYESWPVPPESKSLTFTLEAMKSQIFFRLVNFEKNMKLLQDIPHIRWLDLAVTFHCLVKSDIEGIKSIRITNNHMEQWGIEADYLKELAGTNTSSLFPASIKTMGEVLFGCCQIQDDADSHDYPQDICNIPINKDMKEQASMYVLTNQQGINGATCILYEGILASFSDRIGSDLYILPSSIHEALLIPVKWNIRACDLAAMVREINNTQLADEEVLSDNVYLYSRKDKSISII